MDDDLDELEQAAYGRGLATGFLLAAAMFAFLAVALILAVISVLQ